MRLSCFLKSVSAHPHKKSPTAGAGLVMAYVLALPRQPQLRDTCGNVLERLGDIKAFNMIVLAWG